MLAFPFPYFPDTLSMYFLTFSIELSFLPLTLTTASACCAIALAVGFPTPNTQRNSSSVTNNLFFNTSVSLLAYFVFSNSPPPLTLFHSFSSVCFCCNHRIMICLVFSSRVTALFYFYINRSLVDLRVCLSFACDVAIQKVL